MKIAPFGVEQWMNRYEGGAVTNLAETCVDSLTVEELLDLSGRKDDIRREIMGLLLSYGDIEGSDELRGMIAALHEKQSAKNVMIMNGGSAANFLSFYTLVEPGYHVISVTPTYQQLISIPQSMGADVELLHLRPEDGFMPDLQRLADMITPKTKLICLNNPNNPTGALMERDCLSEIVRMASKVGAWIHCDEVYRYLVHDQSLSVPSVADMYERAVVTGSMSKCFSLAGLRVGWVVGPESFMEDLFAHRDYTTISCGRIDDLLARVAIKHKDAILGRNLGIVRRCAAALDTWILEEPAVGYVRPRAGTTAFIHYNLDVPSKTFCKGLYDHDGTFLVPGACFDMDRWFRMGYAYNPKRLEQGLGRISGYIRMLENS